MEDFSNTNTLVIDTAFPLVQVGLLWEDTWLAFHQSEAPPLQSLFQGAELCLQSIAWKAISQIAFCEGPGSLLGIRLAAMTIRSWKKLPEFKKITVWAYNCFSLAIEMIKEKRDTQEDPFYLLSDSRRGYWHCLKSDLGLDQGIEVNAVGLSSIKGDIWYLPQKKIWQEIPENAHSLDYNLENYAHLFSRPKVLKKTKAPDAFLAKKPEFVKWTPERHRL